MKRFFSFFPAIIVGCLLPSCDLAKLSAERETRKLKEKFERLESERKKDALDSELEEARRQLAIALSALEEQRPAEEGVSPEVVNSSLIEIVDGNSAELDEFKDIPRAIVVEEAPLDDEWRSRAENEAAFETTVH